MAKLSAHGHEVARIELRKDLDPDQYMSDKEEVVYSFRSDRHILIKRKVHLKPGLGDPEGRWHDWGWKRWKVVNELTKEGAVIIIAEVAKRWADVFQKRGRDVTLEVHE